MKYNYKIDFQAHYLPPAYYEFLNSEKLLMPDGFPTPEWDEELQKEVMEYLGIDFALLSLSSPSLYTADEEKSLKYARLINKQGSEIVSRNRNHLGFIATLPLPYLSGSICEAIYAIDELGAEGIGLMTNYRGLYLGDSHLDKLMEELNQRRALVIVHPTEPAVMIPQVNEDLPIPAMEYFFETTRTFVNMVAHDTFYRFPDIKWVFPHAGAFLPILADRFESFALMLRFMDPNRRTDIMADLKHVYFDVAGFSEQKQLEMLLRQVEDSHILYGSDTPYTAIEACVGQTEALETTTKLLDAQRQKIFTNNALELLPRLRELPQFMTQCTK